MKLIKPSFLIKEQEPGLLGIYRQIEYAGRICYKSSDKITETSAKEFVDRMINNKHYAMLEFGTVYLDLPQSAKDCYKIQSKYYSNTYSIVTCSDKNHSQTHWYITTNYRVLIQNGWLDDLQYICEPTEYHEKRTTVKFICDRGVSHELVRHRVFSFAQESTRYCNYSKDKFNNELTFIIPSWFNKNAIVGENNEKNYSLYSEHLEYEFPNVLYEIEIEKINEDTKERIPWSAEDWIIHSLRMSEVSYFKALEQGWKAQQARAVLPNALKTEIIVTGFISDWEHFFELRDSNKAHPDMQALAKPLHEEFKSIFSNV